MNSVKIGNYQMDTAFGLYLPEYTIPAPVPQTKFIDIIGRDGSIDLSNAFGVIHYKSREWDLAFKNFDPSANWHTLATNVMNAIHGQRLNFIFDDDPNWYWTGRIIVQGYTSNKGEGTLKVKIVSDPYKYAILTHIVTSTVPVGEETFVNAIVNINNTKRYMLTSLSSPFACTQDLHGYANPWPAGGGKNKINDSLRYTATETTVYIGAESNSYDIQLKAGTYTISVDFSGESYGMYYRESQDGSNTALWYSGSSTTSKTFTIAADGMFRFWAYRNADSGGVDPTKILTVQIEEGSTATAYAPYSNICPISGRTGLSVYVSPTQDPDDATVYNVDWSTQAGTVYGGTLDVVTGVLTVNYGIVDMGDITWIKSSSSVSSTGGSVFVKSISAIGDGMKARVRYAPNTMLSSEFKTCSSDVWFINDMPDFSVFSNASNIYFADSRYSDAATFKTAMSGVQLVYELATPLTFQLTSNQIELLTGQNYLWTDTGETLSATVIEPIDVENIGSRPTVPTVTASADMILTFGNFTYAMQAGTAVIPQLVLESGSNYVYANGTGTLSFSYSEGSL